MAQSAVLLPARLETRFDEIDGVSRLRVIVVPDRCWFDRRHGATEREIELLLTAVRHAGGALFAGQAVAEGPNAASAFAALVGAIGPAHALWLATTFPARVAGDTFDVDPDAGPRENVPQRTTIVGLPARIDLVAETKTDRVHIATLSPRPRLLLEPQRARTASNPDDDSEEWWPRWPELVRAGLATTITPSPVTPGDVLALYAIGVGDSSAADFLDRHRAVGDLGMLRVGDATNTVAGSPTVDLVRDPEGWRALATREPDADEGRVAHAIAGRGNAGRPLPGGGATEDADRLGRALVATLFPALAAHTLREHWSAPSRTVAELHDWAIANIRPDGPIAPIRIGQQPYGLWPVSAWSQWQSDEPEFRTVRHAAAARDALIAAAEDSGARLTVAGANAEEVWDLLGRTPTSVAYEARLGVPRSIAETIGDPAARQQFYERIDTNLTTVDLGLADRATFPVGDPWAMPLGLVLPRETDDNGRSLETGPWHDLDEPKPDPQPWRWIAACCNALCRGFTDTGIEANTLSRLEEDISWWPASLWWRLTVVSGLIALDHAVREQDGTDGPLLPSDESTLLDRVRFRQLANVDAPATASYHAFVHALREVAEQCDALRERALPLVERTLAGLLDTASYRVDPCLTGAAWRRLEQSTDAQRPVGLYAWVDGPLDGVPGPDLEAGVQLTPSYRQARLAAVMRDKALRDPERRWDVQITSDRVRAAMRLADDVRAGAHPAEAVGREVERLIAERTAIDAVRTKYPVRTEHAGRRTCDGLQVLEAARSVSGSRQPHCERRRTRCDRCHRIARWRARRLRRPARRRGGRPRR